MKSKLVQNTAHFFQEKFNTYPEKIFLSPGRINIIGEHVDYNNGYVLPAAINKYICVAIKKSGSTQCEITAKDLNDTYVFDVAKPLEPIDKMWANYLLGVVHQLKEKGGGVSGFQMAFSSTIPMGAGLSSSAALECGIAYALNKVFDLGLNREEIALMGQKAEHTFAGVNCGIMDQFASVFGKKKQVIQLDCSTLEYNYYKVNFKKHTLVLLDSCVKHSHLTSGYNDRREEVEKGLAVIKKHFPTVQTCRDCSPEMLHVLENKLGEILYKRCLFVVNEINRVKEAIKAIEHKDCTTLGQLMTETHKGLSENYEVSCEELDFLVATALQSKAVLGARMMGGGFGGCSINLIEKGKEDEVIATVADAYKKHFGIDLKPYKIKISKGTSEYKKTYANF